MCAFVFFAALFVSQSLNGAKPKFEEENIQCYQHRTSLTERRQKIKLKFVMPKYDKYSKQIKGKLDTKLVHVSQRILRKKKFLSQLFKKALHAKKTCCIDFLLFVRIGNY